MISQNQHRLDSLLKERDLLIIGHKVTAMLDRELIKLSYSPKVVLTKTGNSYMFHYYLLIDEPAIERFKERLSNTFKISSVSIDSASMKCTVTFKAEATEEDMRQFYTSFGYDGIIYN